MRGSAAALLLVGLACGVALTCLGLMVVGLCPTRPQANAVSNLSAVLFGGLGGGLVQVALLLAVARAVAPFTPNYWAISGLQVVLAGGSRQ